MFQTIYQRFRRGCMMLFRKEGEEVAFIGTAFVVHPQGYLLTTAHLLYSRTNLMAVPWEFGDEFVPMRTLAVTPVGVTVVRSDSERDLALLRFAYELDISMPDHVVGLPAESPVGGSVGCLGYGFGYRHIYNQVIQQAIISAKIISRNQTHCILFDTLVHDGLRGGPLVSLSDGRVIGVVGGRFAPEDPSPFEGSPQAPLSTNLGYAVSIEYGVRMMEDEGLEII